MLVLQLVWHQLRTQAGLGLSCGMPRTETPRASHEHITSITLREKGLRCINRGSDHSRWSCDVFVTNAHLNSYQTPGEALLLSIPEPMTLANDHLGWRV